MALATKLLTTVIVTTMTTTSFLQRSLDDKPIYSPYVYKAKVKSVYDGDTVDLEIDLGLDTLRKCRIRLYRIDAWEVKGPERPDGLIARNWLRSVIPNESTIYLKTIEDRRGKYGRLLGELYTADRRGVFHNINDALVTLGHAEYVDYD